MNIKSFSRTAQVAYQDLLRLHKDEAASYCRRKVENFNQPTERTSSAFVGLLLGTPSFNGSQCALASNEFDLVLAIRR